MALYMRAVEKCRAGRLMLQALEAELGKHGWVSRAVRRPIVRGGVPYIAAIGTGALYSFWAVYALNLVASRVSSVAFGQLTTALSLNALLFIFTDPGFTTYGITLAARKGT
ncbi:MAG: hypothetical protein M3Y76_10345, partial [Chloroflexota bacterium]|nr:hypothetical protein [Chloroflexota bacterium]